MSIFTKIINGEIPSFAIIENDLFVAFLDINPLVRGHVLVVPKQEIDKVYMMSDADLAAMFVFAKPISKAIEKAFHCKRCGFAVIGLEVPHAHLHIVPINSADDLNFTRLKLQPSKEDLQKDQSLIKHFL